MEEILIVDGYNIIGATSTFQDLGSGGLEEARDWLIKKLAEYQGYTGIKVYLVFDAHLVPGIAQAYRQHKVEIIYTKEKETADEHIERLVQELKRVQRRIVVATSDHTEQWVVFGQGALRKSARELIMELEQMEQNIKEALHHDFQQKHKGTFPLSPEMAELFEKWRRGQ